MLQIIFLGKISAEKQKYINDRGLNTVIKTYAKYVPGDEMLRQIKNADAIAFLVDKTIGENYQLYNKCKASGTSAFCLSFGIPCIVSDDFLLDEALKSRAIIYHDSRIETVLFDIINGKLTKDHFKRLKQIPLPAEYSFDYQRRHYGECTGARP